MLGFGGSETLGWLRISQFSLARGDALCPPKLIDNMQCCQTMTGLFLVTPKTFQQKHIILFLLVFTHKQKQKQKKHKNVFVYSFVHDLFLLVCKHKEKRFFLGVFFG